MSFALRRTRPEDAAAMLALFQAAANGPGLARYPDEIDADYIAATMARSTGPGGISIGAFSEERLVGEIHAWRPGPRKFAHVLGDLTIAVDPKWQGQGLGTSLFAALFDTAREMVPPIERIELFVHTGNPGARALYERLGFAVEGRMPGRLKLDSGEVLDDFAMVKRLA